jgi:membrane fusion protein (multidrug efflux system)
MESNDQPRTDVAVKDSAPTPPASRPIVTTETPKATASAHSDAAPASAVQRPPAQRLPTTRIIFSAIALLVLVAICYFGVPMVRLALNTVSTDDAYVSVHVTFVAPRVAGQVERVLVDDNNRVKKGDLVVQLDKEPYQVQVDIKEALLATAKADAVVAAAQARAAAAQARSSRFKVERAMEEVHNQVAQLRATVAALASELAIRDRAFKDFERAKEIMKTPGAIAQQELDLKLQEYLVAKSKVRQSLEGVYQIRAALGLPIAPVNAEELTTVPKALAETPSDLDQTFSTVRQAASELIQALATLGVDASSFDLLPRQIIEEFFRRDPKGDIDRIFQDVFKKAPTIMQANAKVGQAQHDLRQAKLNLSYCDVYAEIDGVVARRKVNPGNNVQAGQSLMTIRSLTEIWIDSNFKETQLADLRIGQQVKIEVDMYGRRQEYEGRITGFTMGTGQTLALLPPQNATGNFVKIVQRLPVRIELLNYDPDRNPLFPGLSVTPYVYVYKPLVENDPGKGKFLQPLQSAGEKE